MSAAACCAYAAAAILLVVMASAIGRPILSGPESERRVAIVFYTEDEDAVRARVAEGVRLLATQAVSKLVMAGGWRPGRDFHGAAEMRQTAIAQGATPGLILIDRGSNDSWSNLEQARAALAHADATPHSLVLVSDRLHLLRLSLIARLQELRPVPAMSPTADPALDIVRLNHELMAYVALALPRDLVRAVLNRLRHA